MAKYELSVTKTTIETAIVTIEADSISDAVNSIELDGVSSSLVISEVTWKEEHTSYDVQDFQYITTYY